MSAQVVAFWVLLASLCGAAVTGFIVAGRWMMSRVEVPAEVERFANAITPENADVLMQEEFLRIEAFQAVLAEIEQILDDSLVSVETLTIVAEIEALLDDCLVHLDRMRLARAAA